MSLSELVLSNKQTSETLLGLICALINGDSRTGSTHKKSPETISGTIACLFITKIQHKYAYHWRKALNFEIHVHHVLHHVSAKTCADCTSFTPLFASCRCKSMCKLHLMCTIFAPSKVQFAPFFAPSKVQHHSKCNLHRFLHHSKWNLHLCLHTKRGAMCTCIYTYMVQKVVQTRCNLHMFLHLHGAKHGAHEVHAAHGFAPRW